MKKAWIFLIALLLLALCVPVFADMAPTGGTFTSWNWGNFFPYLKIGSNDAAAGFGPQWDPAFANSNGAFADNGVGGPWGVDQEWTFAYSGKNYGFNATFEFSMLNLGDTSWAWWETWYQIFDVVKLHFGAPRITDYNLSDLIELNTLDRYVNGEYSGTIQITPVPGASLAFSQFVPGTSAWLSGAGLLPSYNIADNFGIAGNYEIANIGKIMAYYKARNSGSGATAKKQLFSAGFNYTGMKNVGGMIAYLGNYADSSNAIHKGYISASYTMDQLYVAADVAARIEQVAPKTSFAVEVQPEYTIMGPWAIGALVGYDDGKGVNWFNWGDADFAGFEFWPYVKASFDNGSYLRIGFLYASGNKDAVAEGLGAGANGGFAANQDAVYGLTVTYLWAF